MKDEDASWSYQHCMLEIFKKIKDWKIESPLKINAICFYTEEGIQKSKTEAVAPAIIRGKSVVFYHDIQIEFVSCNHRSCRMKSGGISLD